MFYVRFIRLSNPSWRVLVFQRSPLISFRPLRRFIQRTYVATYCYYRHRT